MPSEGATVVHVMDGTPNSNLLFQMCARVHSQYYKSAFISSICITTVQITRPKVMKD